MAERILTGDKALDRKLKRLERKSANRIARSGLGKGARVAAKAIKAEVPSSMKSVRRSIGSYVKKAKRGPNAGITEAKAGFSVGTKKKRAASVEKNRAGKPGVGISFWNAHWWVLGTNNRDRWRTGQGPTGSTEGHDVVPKAIGGAKSSIRAAIAEGTKKALIREAKKR